MWGLWGHQIINIKYIHTLCQAISFIVVFPKETDVFKKISSRILLHMVYNNEKKLKQTVHENLNAWETVLYKAYGYIVQIKTGYIINRLSAKWKFRAVIHFIGLSCPSFEVMAENLNYPSPEVR